MREEDSKLADQRQRVEALKRELRLHELQVSYPGLRGYHIRGYEGMYIRGYEGIYIRGYEGMYIRGYEGMHIRGYEGMHIRGYEGMHILGTFRCVPEIYTVLGTFVPLYSLYPLYPLYPGFLNNFVLRIFILG